MRIALFADAFAPPLNSVSTILERLVRETESRGGEARVFTAADPRHPQSRSGPAHRFSSIAWPFHPELRVAMPATRTVERLLAQFKPSLVHAATPFGVGLAGRRAAHAMHLPFVTSYHIDLAASARYYRLGALAPHSWRYLRWFHDGGRRTFCPTLASLQTLRDRGFRRLAVWARGVDTTRFAPTRRTRALRLRLGVDDDAIVIAYVGRMAREKGLDSLLTAMACLRHLRSDLVFAFVGDGPYLEHCRRAAQGRAVFLGPLEGDALAAFYASSDIAVAPSSTDTFADTLVESMASGLPIVAAGCPTTREIIGAAGTFHTPDDGPQLANRILELVANGARRRALGRLARLRSAQFSWRAAFDELFDEYEAVLSGREITLAPGSRRRAGQLAPTAPR
jgi:glycosyltransferase involved in cell wall biosynthesis